MSPPELLRPSEDALWVDTHCHLDAPEFDADRSAVIARARQAGVGHMVLPAVLPAHFAQVRELAHACQGAYALGTHPLYVRHACVAGPGDEPAQAVPAARGEALVAALASALAQWAHDPRLVAVGEIGLDHFVPELQTPELRALQAQVYADQLAVAAEAGLPVILHVRRSADTLLKHLRQQRARGQAVAGGIAHAFNGSQQQARAFLDLGFKLGFGGAMTFERALQIRALAQWLPGDAMVLETDAPDIPPHWLYQTAQVRAQARAQGALSRNEPAELPRIAQTLAKLRGWSLDETRERTTANALAALPRLARLAPCFVAQ